MRGDAEVGGEPKGPGHWSGGDRGCFGGVDLDLDAPVVLAQAYVNRSWDLAVLGRSGDAVADATRAIVIDSGDPVVVARAHLHRSFALSDLGLVDQAVADAEAVVLILPVDHELRITAEEWLAFLRRDGTRGA